MPELPEVETVIAGLINGGLAGRRIVAVRILWPRTIGPAGAAVFRRRLKGRLIAALKRRGKYIALALDSQDWLLVHLRMTGRLVLAPSNMTNDRHDRVVLGLDDGRALRLHDPRKFARMLITAGPAEEPLASLGPEPLQPGFSLDRLNGILKRRRMIKPLLLDQRAIAGIGNIYADEALWDAGIHPMRRSDTLDPAEAARLRRAIRRVLRRGIRAGGTSLGSGHGNFMDSHDRRGNNAANLRVFRRQGQPCPRCGAKLARLIVGQRSTHICPACQPP